MKISKLWKNGGVSVVSFEWIKDVCIRILEGQKDIYIKYNNRTGKIYVKCFGHTPDREVKTVEMLLCAFERVHYELNRSFKMKISCHDLCYVKSRRMFCYCKKNTARNLICIPDYWFINWREHGIESYEKLVSEILNKSNIPPEKDKLFWIGNTQNNVKRKKMHELGKSDVRMEIIASEEINENGEKKFVSLLDHMKYKYLLDVEGIAWSSRRKLLLFMNRPLFIVEDEWIEFWSNDIKPYVHYIPVKSDLSDLGEKLDWAECHSDECNEIARRAQEYAINNLMPNNAIDYMAELLRKEGCVI